MAQETKNTETVEEKEIFSTWLSSKLGEKLSKLLIEENEVTCKEDISDITAEDMKDLKMGFRTKLRRLQEKLQAEAKQQTGSKEEQAYSHEKLHEKVHKGDVQDESPSNDQNDDEFDNENSAEHSDDEDGSNEYFQHEDQEGDHCFTSAFDSVNEGKTQNKKQGHKTAGLTSDRSFSTPNQKPHTKTKKATADSRAEPKIPLKPPKPKAPSTRNMAHQQKTNAPEQRKNNVHFQKKGPSPADKMQYRTDRQSPGNSQWLQHHTQDRYEESPMRSQGPDSHNQFSYQEGDTVSYPRNMRTPPPSYSHLYQSGQQNQQYPANYPGHNTGQPQVLSDFDHRIQFSQEIEQSNPLGSYSPSYGQGYGQPVGKAYNQGNMLPAANTGQQRPHGQQPRAPHGQGGGGGPGTVKNLLFHMDPAYRERHAQPGPHQDHSSSNQMTNNPQSHNAIAPPRERLAERMKSMSTPIPKLQRTDSEGPQAFQLPTSQLLHDLTRRLAIKVVGTSRRDSPSHKVVMVMGATGAGKSTLINGMVNYIYGVLWKDDFRFKLINDEGNQSQACSQTKWITAYTIYWDPESALQYDLTVIDTPGFGDTSGIAADKALVAQIKDLFSITPDQHGIDQIHGIGFVTQASLARLTHTQKYVFDSILSIFGTDVGENILLLTTFADGEKQPVIEAVRAAKVPFQEKGIFKFNNSALFADNRDENKPSNQCSQNRQEDSGDDDNFNEMFWKMGIKSFKKFFRHLDGMKVKSLQLTKEVLEERQQLEIILNGIQPQIQAGLIKVARLEQIKGIMEKYEAAIIANKKFTVTVETPKATKIDLGTGEHVTNCLKCNLSCHYPCYIPQDKDKAQCRVMGKDGNCGVCPGKCHWDMHYNNPYRFEVSIVLEVITSEDLKKKYDDATSGKNTHNTMKANIQKELKDLSKQVMAMVCKGQASLKRLDEIALKPNPLTEVEYLELLIESEKFEAKTGWMDRVHALERFLKQAKLLANMRRKGEAHSTDALVDGDMLAETWWKNWQATDPIPVATAEEIATKQKGQDQGWTGRIRKAVGW